jgi:hypothetical protein
VFGTNAKNEERSVGAKDAPQDDKGNEFPATTDTAKMHSVSGEDGLCIFGLGPKCGQGCVAVVDSVC